MMNALLLPEKPLVILPSLAVAIGLNEAIVLQQVNYWLKTAKENPKLGRQHEGRTWIYNDYENWQEQNFPFWSVSTIKRAIYSLEKKELLLVDVETDSKLSGGKRKWYAIDYEKLQEIGCVQFEHTVGSKWTDPQVKMSTPSVQNEPTIYKESETTSETTQIEEKSLAQPSDDGTQTPTKSATKKKRDTVPATLMTPMKNAIVEIFKWDWSTMTDSEKGQIQKAARELCLAKVTTDQIPALYTYCETKFDHFKPMALPSNRQEWLKDSTHDQRAPDTRADRPARDGGRPGRAASADAARIAEVKAFNAAKRKARQQRQELSLGGGDHAHSGDDAADEHPGLEKTG